MILISFFSTDIEKLNKFWKKNSSFSGEKRGSLLNKPNNIGGLLQALDSKDFSLKKEIYINKPMAIYEYGEEILCSNAQNEILVFSKNLDLKKKISNNLFNSIHSISKLNDNILLLSSTGIDSVISFDILNNKGSVLWTALNTKYGFYDNGERRNINFNDKHNFISYPTLLQTTHLNSVIFEDNLLYVSLFHQGEIICLDMVTNKIYTLFNNLSCPHGIHSYIYNNNKYYIFSDTNNNKVYYDIIIKNFKVIGYKILEDNFSWVQDAKIDVKNDRIYVLDSNNNKVSIYSYSKKEKIYDYRYGSNKRVFDLIVI